jgi:hypothetical protein
MRTRAPGAELTTVRLDSASGVPLYRQLCEEVRRAISDGTLVAGARLPATRVLMKDLTFHEIRSWLRFGSLSPMVTCRLNAVPAFM